MIKSKLYIVSFIFFVNCIGATEIPKAIQPSVIFVQPSSYPIIKSFESQIEKSSINIPEPKYIPYVFPLSEIYKQDSSNYFSCGVYQSEDEWNFSKNASIFNVTTVEERTLINGVVGKYIVLRLVK